MLTLQDIQKEIAGLRDPGMRELCSHIAREVSVRIDKDGQGFWTIQRLAAWVGRMPSDEALLACVLFLASQKSAKLLEMHFLLFDPEHPDDIGETIDGDEVVAAYKTGFLVHPVTGREVRSFEDCLLPYFVPNPALKS